MKTYKVKKGGSTLNLKTTVKGYSVLDSNWICVHKLLEDITSEDVAVLTRNAVREVDNSAFNVYFSPDDTALESVIEGKTYYWQITMYNDTLTPKYSNTEIRKLEIEYKV